MVHVIATIQVADGKRDAVLTEFRKTIPLVRAEDGCIEYGTAVDVPSGLPPQGELRPDVIVVVEKWASLAALKAHSQAPHMGDHRRRTDGLVQWVHLQVLDPVD